MIKFIKIGGNYEIKLLKNMVLVTVLSILLVNGVSIYSIDDPEPMGNSIVNYAIV